MRKLIIIVTIFLMLIATLSSCEESFQSYPVVKIRESFWGFEKRIEVDKDYMLIDNHPYDIIETEKGIDVIVHFEKKVEK